MDTDTFDTLLDSSAPATRTLEPREIRALSSRARSQARRGRRRVRTTALTGAIGLLLVGGTGLAVASGDWSWIDGLENPDRSYAFTAPTWGECELRVSGYTMSNVFVQGDVNRIVDDWFATTDVEAAAAPYVQKYLDFTRQSNAESPELESDPRQADLDAWLAHEQALGEALHDELVAHGYDGAALAGAQARSQLHCEGEDWGGEGGEQ